MYIYMYVYMYTYVYIYVYILPSTGFSWMFYKENGRACVLTCPNKKITVQTPSICWGLFLQRLCIQDVFSIS